MPKRNYEILEAQEKIGKIFSGIPEMKDYAADILIKCSNFSYGLDAINI